MLQWGFPAVTGAHTHTHTHISFKTVLLSVLEGICGLLFPQGYLFRASCTHDLDSDLCVSVS